MPDLASLHARLRGEQVQIRVAWTEVRRHWNDAVANAFQAQHLQPCEKALADYMRALEKVAQVLERAEREASNHG
jgi:hypothetical protein